MAWRAVPSVSLNLNHGPLCHCLIFGCLITLDLMYLLIVFLPPLLFSTNHKDIISQNVMRKLRPLSPHLLIYKPQLTSTFPISHRISGAFLATIVLFSYLLYLKMGRICFTYENFYLFFFYYSKCLIIVSTVTAFILGYYFYSGVAHLGLAAHCDWYWYFKSFVFWLTIYAALALIPAPSDFLLLDRIKVILILGGSASLYLVGIASKPLEREFCLHSLFLSSLSGAILWSIAAPTYVVLALFLYFCARLVLPMEVLFFLVLLWRLHIFVDYGPALFAQTYLIVCLIKWSRNTRFLGGLYMTILLCCIWLAPGMLKAILFPLSGALAIFFFFIAASGKEHLLAALLYLINFVFISFQLQNESAIIYIIYIYALIILIFGLLTIITYNHKNSKLTEHFLHIILEGKIEFLTVFFGLIFLLLPVSGYPEWVYTLAETLLLQVTFLKILIYLFSILIKKR